MDYVLKIVRSAGALSLSLEGNAPKSSRVEPTLEAVVLLTLV